MAMSAQAQQTQPSEVALIMDDQQTATDTITLGIRLHMDDGWKTYWRHGGDAGLPPHLEWHKTDGVQNIALQYPAPQKYRDHGLETIGYAKEVVYPLVIETNADAVTLEGTLEYVVCREICLPLTHQLDAQLVNGKPVRGIEVDGASVRHAVQRLPITHKPYPFEVREAQWARQYDGSHEWRIMATRQTPFQNPTVFIETLQSGQDQEGSLWIGDATVRLSQDGSRAWFLMASDGEQDAPPQLVRLTVVDGDMAVEQTMPVTFIASQKETSSYFLLLLFAFAGGLILNVMPCVLPVLSLKLHALLRQNHDAKTPARQSMLYHAVGIYVAFGVLALMVWSLQSVGVAVGWGFQFQEPVFIVTMMVIMLIFAAHLMGWIHLTLPSRLMTMMPRASGDIANGAFATLLATPCSAPFLGVAVGFALVGSAMDMALIFAFVATGFAAPWLVVAMMPRLLSYLPRPGQWMVTLERFFAVLLLLTALWLASIAAVQVWQQRDGETRDSFWHDFTPESIHNHVEQGRVVFVDVTADWCLTCRVNEARVLNTDETRAVLSEPSVIAMRADWTQRDEFIGTWLQSFGRSALPFYVVFGEAAPRGIVLPEWLTHDTVRRALMNATNTQKGRES